MISARSKLYTKRKTGCEELVQLLLFRHIASGLVAIHCSRPLQEPVLQPCATLASRHSPVASVHCLLSESLFLARICFVAGATHLCLNKDQVG